MSKDSVRKPSKQEKRVRSRRRIRARNRARSRFKIRTTNRARIRRGSRASKARKRARIRSDTVQELKKGFEQESDQGQLDQEGNRTSEGVWTNPSVAWEAKESPTEGIDQQRGQAVDLGGLSLAYFRLDMRMRGT